MRTVTRLIILLLLLGLFATRPTDTNAATWWNLGVHGSTITVCFAGNATEVRPDRVRQTVDYMQHFEFVANINFIAPSGNPIVYEANTVGRLGYLQCESPLWLPNGNNYYQGDMRIALVGTNVLVTPTGQPPDPPGKVPGVGCTQDLEAASFANPPNELEPKRSCQYNVKIGDDGANGVPYLNHTLHEIGHALGLAHEHARTDENANCVYTGHGEYHKLSSGFMTPYDKDSVMHYVFSPIEVPSCTQVGGNYSNIGLTDYDKLSLHILYPEDNYVAEFVGTTVVKAGEPLNLTHGWAARGANMAFVVTDIKWQINGLLYSSGSTVSATLNQPGEYTLRLTYTDFLGRDYEYNGIIRVLDEDEYQNVLAAVGITAFPGGASSQIPLAIDLQQETALVKPIKVVRNGFVILTVALLTGFVLHKRKKQQ